MADERMTDGSGLRAVFLAERKMLLRLLAARLGGMSEAEDALHDLWLRLESNGTGPVAQPAAYLYRMANNIAFDRRRSAARHAARDGGWLEAQPRSEEMPGVEQALIAREQLARIEAALATLPEPAARAFRRFRFDGVPQKAIAAELGISISSLEKLLQRAYRRVHESMRETGAKETSADSGRRRRPTNGEDVGQ